MPSTASTVARVLFRHGLEADQFETEVASEEQSLRAQLDREHVDAKQSAKDAASRPPPSGGRAPIMMPSDEGHIDNRVREISRLRDKHADRRKAQRDWQARELATARGKGPTSGNHAPQAYPEPHQGLTHVIWKDLDSARQEAMRAVWRSTAALRDKADADVLDLSQSTSGSRYMQPGARMAGDVQSRHERAHLDINKREQQQMDALARRFNDEIAAERRRIHQHAVERASLEQRQMEENRRSAGGR
jgi:hypothetical protein